MDVVNMIDRQGQETSVPSEIRQEVKYWVMPLAWYEDPALDGACAELSRAIEEAFLTQADGTRAPKVGYVNMASEHDTVRSVFGNGERLEKLRELKRKWDPLGVVQGIGSSGDGQKGRQRIITACFTCRRRKVKCDHKQPVCSPCQRGSRVCTYASPQPTPQAPSRTASGNRVSRPNLRSGQEEIRSRLERLEQLLERAISGGSTLSQAIIPTTETRSNIDQSGDAVASTRNETLSTDGYDGALLLEADGGQSRWVSSLHYALLADEIHDVRMLLGGQAGSAPVESPPPDHATPPFPFAGTTVDSLAPWSPKSSEVCSALLDIFFSNVDPMTRLVHKPTLQRRFSQYLNHTYGASADRDETDTPTSDHAIHTFEPLALAVFYSAVNSLSLEEVPIRFGLDKEALLVQLERGVEYGLGRESFLTTSSIEVLQALVLLLTCQSREDDMSRTWTLLGLVVRIALSQGLHREPSLFPSSSMDVIQIETRRRLWHQICHLDFRSAEGSGQEPTIADDDYTTLLPRNINDEDLIEGTLPTLEAYSTPGFTDMTGHLIRLNGIHCFRRIVRSTYRLERRIKSSAVNGNNNLNPIAELQSLFMEVRSMVDEMVTHLQTQYLQYCDPGISPQRMALGLAAVIEWRCWSLFWLRTPKHYREAVVSPDIRETVLGKSVNLVESLNMMPKDKYAQRFQWHISSHACFQAIMHIVSELETTEFQTPNHHTLRSRALDVLRKTMETRGREVMPMWNVINRIISNCLAKNSPAAFSTSSFPVVFSPSGVVPDVGYSTAVLPQPIAQDSLLPTTGNPFLDLSEITDPTMAFGWEFWNFDPTDPGSL
ncbi:hypothetical protein BDW74DRAFT_165569 [Aspergillus multicolor]|uniref:Zn(II)2Cys6 domain-containing transcription factor hasF n=1 Tax=Aspergillus multicolor TaxID=41759 RepID=UPI003CCDBA57